VSLRTAVLVSLVLHAGLFLLPAAGLLPGPGRPGPESGEGIVVSLFESPGRESPALESEPETPPEPVVPPVPDPVPDPASPVSTAPSPEATAPPTPAVAGGGEAGAIPGPGHAGAAGGDGSEPVPPRTAFTPPQLLAGALPIDPQDSEALDVPAEIPVRIRVGTDGQVLEIVPQIADLPPAVTAALERSAHAMRFLPARRGNRPVEAWFAMTFVFRR